MNGLGLWLKTGSSVRTDGSKVLVWADESGNHHDAFVVGESKPILVPNELNGFPVIRFNGKDNNMQTVPFVTFENKRGTLLIVFRLNGPSFTSGGGVSSLVSTYLGNGITWQLCASQYVYIYYDGVGSEGMPLATVAMKQWEVGSLMRTNDSSITIYRRGDPKIKVPITNNQPDTNPVKIGSNGRLEVLNGDIAEIILYNRALDQEEFAAVNEYLATKYQIKQPAPPFTETVWFYILIAFIILAVSIAITKYLSQRKLKHKLNELKKQAQLDKERLRISREMHDDIGAGLTQIILMSESAKSKSAGNGDKELEGIADASRKLVSNMSEIIWSLHPENKTLDQLFAYLREQMHKLLEYSGIEYSIHFPGDADHIFLNNEQRRNLLLVVKEIVHNAVKYSGAKQVSVNASLREQVLHFEINDNGTGFDTEKKYSGNGLKNIHARISELQGSLNVESNGDSGTKYVFTIPVG
ncbi:sensor histidine kinase [Lacibacter sp. H407]|uniref:sensor histidine kinase n=1 Tax=Lacibacter sp. H407 TaxID=3133423 RepID=UPI0030C0DC7B